MATSFLVCALAAAALPVPSCLLNDSRPEIIGLSALACPAETCSLPQARIEACHEPGDAEAEPLGEVEEQEDEAVESSRVPPSAVANPNDVLLPIPLPVPLPRTGFRSPYHRGPPSA
jgi:hypothetical protein